MQTDEYFRLNGVDVGFSAQTDVRVTCGRLRVRLNTPPMRLTQALRGGLLEHAWRPIADCFMPNGLTIAAFEDLALPLGQYGHTFKFPYYDAAKYLQRLHVYGSDGSPNFFGTITVDKGWLTVKGLVSYEDETPDPQFAMSVEICRRFDAHALIPPRKKLSLAQALKLPPDQVYWLSIDNTKRVTTFPEEILGFKNLEDLWLSASFGTTPVPLPEAIFSLTNLHSLNLHWAGFSIGALSPNIANLTKLETLRLTSNALTSLPDSIAALTRLELLDVSYNTLKTLPDCIGLLPALRTLEAEGNRFESLPKNLINIPSVRVNHAYRQLFRDVRYQTKNDAPVDASQFMQTSQPQLFEAAKKHLNAHSNDSELITTMLENSTYAVYAQSHIADGTVALGKSKTGGAPHLPRGSAHPCDANKLLPTFYAQINLSDIAHLQNWLPKQGMLYFYLDDFRYGEGPLVIYANVEPHDLVAHQYTAKTRWSNSDVDAFEDDGAPNVACESTLTFSAGVSLPYVYRATRTRFPALATLLESTKNADRIRIAKFEGALEAAREACQKAGLMPPNNTHSFNALIWSDDYTSQEQAAVTKGGIAEEWINLLTLASVDHYMFGDASTITYCIHIKDLAAADFSNVMCVVGH